jgi:hypothetical protein
MKKKRIPGGFAPRPPGFIAFGPGLIWTGGARFARSPSIPAPVSALRSHPCVALSSAPAIGEFSSICPKETK